MDYKTKIREQARLIEKIRTNIHLLIENPSFHFEGSEYLSSMGKFLYFKWRCFMNRVLDNGLLIYNSHMDDFNIFMIIFHSVHQSINVFSGLGKAYDIFREIECRLKELVELNYSDE